MGAEPPNLIATHCRKTPVQILSGQAFLFGIAGMALTRRVRLAPEEAGGASTRDGVR
jgi:hypothetical protein